jgi:uncharacterized protein (TIGR00290 family)
MSKGNILCSWSGGKDSCFAFMKAIKEGYDAKVLLNVLNEAGKISRSHGIPKHILEQQSAAIGLPIKTISSSWQDYENNFVDALETLKKDHTISHVVFGDIDLQPHRDWEEKVCNKVGIEAVLPLWQQDRKALVTEMLHAGIETIIVSCNETMGEYFLGKTLTPAVIEEIESIGVDACGENGEFHTLVLNCPLFSKRIEVSIVEKVKHENYWFVVMK